KTYKNVVLVLNNAPSVVTGNSLISYADTFVSIISRVLSSVHLTSSRALVIYEYSTHTEDFGTLLDYTQYYTNLTEANEKGKLRWDIEYKARDFYKISKLRSKDWAKVFHRFKKPDRELWEKYVKHVNVSGT
ncbi:758_t:CDS:2, partial [Gigaspora rosea]